LLIFNNIKNYNYSNIEFSELRDKIILAFHQICLHGPIVEEQLLGVVFIIEHIEFHNQAQNQNDSRQNILESDNLSETNSTINTCDMIETFGKFARTSLTNALLKCHLGMLEAFCLAEALLPEK